MRQGQLSRGRRQGNVFSVRISPDVREQLEQQCASDRGPKRLGPWLVWRALQSIAGAGNAGPDVSALPGLAASSGNTSPGATGERLRDRVGSTAPAGGGRPVVVPGVELAGMTDEQRDRAMARWLFAPDPPPPVAERLILDLCAGSGSWSEPYKRAGYPVRRVTLPAGDVRTFVPPDDADVWGVLAAPPCEEFSLAKNGQDRDFARGLETVSACVRIIMTTRPRWWALENPVGLLSRWLGRPSLVFEPNQFGDPWTKRTAIWGSFVSPTPGPFVPAIDGGGPLCVICHPDAPAVCRVAGHRAVTPPGFARAFFEANP